MQRGKHIELKSWGVGRTMWTTVVFAATMALASVGYGDTILLDFGNSSSFRGVSVSSPDENGSYWNSVWSGAFYANMVNAANEVTSVDFGFDSATGTDSFNGPAERRASRRQRERSPTRRSMLSRWKSSVRPTRCSTSTLIPVFKSRDSNRD